MVHKYYRKNVLPRRTIRPWEDRDKSRTYLQQGELSDNKFKSDKFLKSSNPTLLYETEWTIIKFLGA